jgi:HK97 family phage portal protein
VQLSNAEIVPVGDPQARITDPARQGGNDLSAAIEHVLWASHSSYSGDYHSVLTAQTALSCPAVFSCVRLISESIARCVANVFELRSNDSKTKRPDDPIYWLLNEQPNDDYSAMDFRAAIAATVLLRGNAYVEIERDASRRVKALWLIGGPERVQPDRTEDGTLVYVVDNKLVLHHSQVLHFRGLSLNGVDGLSVISQHRNAFHLANQQEAYGSTYFSRGPMPGGIISIPGKPTEDERKQLLASFQKHYGGSQNAGRVVLMSAGMTFTPLAVSNQDAEFLLSRGYQDEQIAKIFGVPPSLIGIQGKSSYASQEQDSIMFVRNCLSPMAARFEQEVNRKLLWRTSKHVRLDLTHLQLGDSASQATMISTLVTCGVLQINEARARYDLNPVELGDTNLVQGAQVTLERAVEGDPVPPLPSLSAVPPSQDEEVDEEPTEDEEAQDEAVARLLTDCYARILRVAGEKAERAQKANKLAEHLQAWYGPLNVQHVSEAVNPFLQFWAVAVPRLDPSNVAVAAKAIAVEFDAESLRLLQKGPTALQDEAPAWFARRSVVIAKEHLKRSV